MKPDARDLHIYGGIAMIGAGVEWSTWGLVVIGAALAYLGVWRMGSTEDTEER